MKMHGTDSTGRLTRLTGGGRVIREWCKEDWSICKLYFYATSYCGTLSGVKSFSVYDGIVYMSYLKDSGKLPHFELQYVGM
jgi:hypothetical protein